MSRAEAMAQGRVRAQAGGKDEGFNPSDTTQRQNGPRYRIIGLVTRTRLRPWNCRAKAGAALSRTNLCVSCRRGHEINRKSTMAIPENLRGSPKDAQEGHKSSHDFIQHD